VISDAGIIFPGAIKCAKLHSPSDIFASDVSPKQCLGTFSRGKSVPDSLLAGLQSSLLTFWKDSRIDGIQAGCISCHTAGQMTCFVAWLSSCLQYIKPAEKCDCITSFQQATVPAFKFAIVPTQLHTGVLSFHHAIVK
jgi:hypothetical protein